MKLERHEDVPDLKAHWEHLARVTGGQIQARLGYVEVHQRQRMDLMLEWIAELGPLSSGIEIGCCEGVMTERLAEHFGDLLAIDFQPGFAERCPVISNVTYQEHDVSAWSPSETVDLVIFSEVLEHLLDPVDVLRRFAARSRRVLASCPINEPLNPETWDVDLLDFTRESPVVGLSVGATAGHVWAMDMDGFRSLLADAGLTVEREALCYPSGVILAA